MLNKFFRKLTVENPREDIKHIHYYFSLGHIGEGYLITVIKQKFKFWFFNIWTTVSMNMFRMPTSADQIVVDFTNDNFDSLQIADIVRSYKKGLLENFNNEIDVVNHSNNNEELKKIIINQLKVKRDRIASIWSNFTVDEKRLLSTFLNGGYEPLCKEAEGSTTYYYVIKRLQEVMIITRIEVVRSRNTEHIMQVQQFNVTMPFAQAFTKNLFGKEI